jgi:hypothetical protein
MQPQFTDNYKYPRGYVRSESTDITKTWAAARKRDQDARDLLAFKVRSLVRVPALAA